jgi:hypothetical protein
MRLPVNTRPIKYLGSETVKPNGEAAPTNSELKLLHQMERLHQQNSDLRLLHQMERLHQQNSYLRLLHQIERLHQQTKLRSETVTSNGEVAPTKQNSDLKR